MAVTRAAMGLAKKREWLKPKHPYMELAVSLSAFWRMSSTSSRSLSRSVCQAGIEQVRGGRHRVSAM
jgi:hypothetical protein